MSNLLTVTLMEFKPLGGGEIECGIFAVDTYACYAYRVASNWNEFKVQFPSVKSIMDHISGRPEFQELEGHYTISDGQIVMNDNDTALYSHIELEGFDEIYD